MKIFAVHNAAGTISEIITTPDEGPAARIVTQAGMLMTEVYVPESLQTTAGVEGNVEELANLVQQYQVIVEPKMAKLERKSDLAS